MRTIKLIISYDGTRYAGWQGQPNGVTVQQRLEEALGRMTGRRTAVVAAGRTDAGVHALAQAASFTTSAAIPCEGFVAGLNSLLPDDIAILSAEEMEPGFHALREARGKLYRYRILESRVRPPMLVNRCWQVRGQLNVAAMRRAAALLTGAHDFESFRAAGCAAKHARRTIGRILIRAGKASRDPLAGPIAGRLIELDFEGEGFVRHMIRNIVGTLVDVGAGRIPADDISAILAARKRTEAGRCAPACGLYLVRVIY